MPHFFWPSLFGVLPTIVLFVWLGTLARDITDVVTGDTSASGASHKSE